MKRRVKAWTVRYADGTVTFAYKQKRFVAGRCVPAIGDRLVPCTIEYDDGKRPAKGKAKR